MSSELLCMATCAGDKNLLSLLKDQFSFVVCLGLEVVLLPCRPRCLFGLG